MRRNRQAKQTMSRRAAVRSVGGATLGGGVALGGVALGAFGAAEPARADGGNPPIVGTWLVTAQRPDRAVRALVFFFSSGIIQWAAAPQQPSQRTDDPADALEYQTVSGGEWRQTGFNEYVYSAIGLDYDARGNSTTIDTTRGTAIFDPLNDSWAGPFTVTETDGSGAPTGGGVSGTVSGRRVGATT